MDSFRRRETAPRLVRPDESTGPLDEVYRRYAPYVAAVILRMTGRDAEVEDLVQDVFVEATRGIEKLREPEAIKAWLATIAVRRTRRALRFRKLRGFLGLDPGADYTRVIDGPAPQEDRLLLASVYEVLDTVTVADRLAFVLHHIEGEKLEIVASRCGCSCATAKRRIARVQGELEKRLGDG
jgi:RNA polymerase sigma-70 factor, ECF subfamily